MARRPSIVAGAIALSVVALCFVVAASSLPIDDFWLSLASARRIMDGAPLDRAVDFNWIDFRPDALNPQWAAQLVLGAAGSAAVALAINALLIGGGLLVLAIRVRRAATAEATAIGMLLALAVLAPHLLARAQSFSILLLPLALLLLELRPAPRWLPIAFGALMVAWANLHGAFVIGQFAAVVAFVAAWRSEVGSREILAVTVLVAFLAPMLNPSGLDLLAYAYAQPGVDVVREISIEWQPAWPWVPVATLFWVFLALLVVGRLLRRWNAGLYDSLLGIGLAALAVSSLRQIPWSVIAMTPLLARDIDALLARRPVLARSVGTVPGFLRGRRLVGLVGIGLVLAVLVQPMRTALPQSVGRVTPDAPVQIADALEPRVAADASARVLNEQVWGGYLAWRLGDRLEIAMDGRLEIRDRETWSRYFRLMHGELDAPAVLADAGVTYAALQPNRDALIGELRAAGWETVVESGQGVLLTAP